MDGDGQGEELINPEEPAEPKEPTPKKPKSELDLAFASANSVKKDLSSLMMSVTSMLNQYDTTGSSWGRWAKGELEALRELQGGLQQTLKGSQGFGHEWVETDSKELRRRHKMEPAVLTHKLKLLTASLTLPMRALQQQLRSISAMKEARDAIADSV